MVTPAPIGLSRYRRIVVLMGAGLSAPSGLPTYRGPGGLWNTVEVGAYATAEALAADPKSVWRFFAQLGHQLRQVAPNAGHLALAAAALRLRSDQALTVLTQNVDGLHTLAGSPNVVELHGSLRAARCTRCTYSVPIELEALASDCPQCPKCGASLRPSVVLFDESLPPEAEWAAKEALRDCDLFLAVGTSGSVAPASNYVRSAEYVGAGTIFANLEPMHPSHPAFHEVYLGPAQELLPVLLA